MLISFVSFVQVKGNPKSLKVGKLRNSKSQQLHHELPLALEEKAQQILRKLEK